VPPSLEEKDQVLKPTDDIRRFYYRGGGWVSYDAPGVRAVIRNRIEPEDGVHNLGFRCAQRGCRQQILKVQP
jgi:formylglycine-generating enzyme required for sulfatase activity